MTRKRPLASPVIANALPTGSSLVFALLAMSGVGCLKASTPTNNNSPGAGGSGNTSTAGTNAVGGSGATPTGGTGSGTGGSSVVIVGGSGGMSPVVKMACPDSPNQRGALPYTGGYTITDAAKSQAQAAVQSMTTTQKANQLRGTARDQFADIFRTPDEAALSIKGFLFADGPRGVNLDPYKPSGTQAYATVFPTASGRGATFNTELEYKIGEAMGDELIAAGRTMMLAPTINILRHPAWARSQETYGEDSFLLGRLGSAYVQGVQTFAPACVKHYAANNVDRKRETQVARMDEQTLQEVYARHFGMVIQDGGVSCVMAAYNLVQSPPESTALNSTQNKFLLNDVLRTGFGFKGMVLSDWWAMPGGQSLPAQASTNAAQAILAGMDMELPWNLNFSTIEAITGTGIQTSDLTAAALRVVTEKYRFNVANTSGAIGLKVPTSKLDTGTFSIVNADNHVALAKQAALEGTVLLKNENNTLPISAAAKTVAVVGLKVDWTLPGISSSGTVNFAQDARIGDLGSSRVIVDPAKAIGPYAGIKAAAPSGVNVVMDDTGGTTVASGADFIVVVAGLTPEDEGEDYTIQPTNSDRDGNLGLDGKHGGTAQNNYIKAIAALGKPMVVVLEGGGAIDVSSFVASVPALVMAWYPGQSGGQALGELLFGKANFSGKLPVSWPASAADLPPFVGANQVTDMGYYLGYRWFDKQKKAPLYPFGHGLSYTKFDYGNLQVPCSTVTPGGVVSVTVDVTNSGAVAGDEAVLLFTSWPSSTVPTRADGYKELKGFQRATVPAGQTARVTIPIRVSDLSYYDTATKSWKIESGPVQVLVGPSADKLTLMDTFTVQ
jgi:beta-glucosidase